MEIRIDRLRLQASGMDPDTARQFGRLLAEQLATMLAEAPPASGDAARFTSLSVSVPGPAGQRPGSVVPAMAAGIARALRSATAGTATAGTGATGTRRTAPTACPGAAR